MNRSLIKPAALLTATLAGTAFGQFSFTGPTTVATGQRPDGVVIGDWDGMNGADLAIATDNLDKVSLFFNNGAGSFGAPVDILTGANTGPGYIAKGNFIGDASTDLAVALQNTNSVLVLQGNGAGQFTAAGTFPVGSDPRFIATGDFNNDGLTDMAVVNRDSNNTTVLTNTGAGFTSASFAVGADPRAVAAGDFNSDGQTDLAVTNSDSRSISLLAGNGAGGFTPAGTLGVPAGTRPEGIVTADFDGDGDDDLASGTGDPDFASVYINQGGTMTGPFAYATGALGVGDINATDFDADGDIDIVVANEDSASISLLANSGAGTFGAPQILSVGANPSHIALGDVAGSGADDIVVTNRDSNSATIYVNNAADACVADFNGDGVVNTQDVLAFLNAWNAGDASADINGDGVINTQDVLAFLNLWNAGC